MYKKKTDRFSFLQILKAEYKQNSSIQINGNQNYEYYSDGRLIQYGVYIPSSVDNRTDAIGTSGMLNTDIKIIFPITFTTIDFCIAYPILTHRTSGSGNTQFHQHVLPGIMCGNTLNYKSDFMISVARKSDLTLTKDNIFVACYAVGHV